MKMTLPVAFALAVSVFLSLGQVCLSDEQLPARELTKHQKAELDRLVKAKDLTGIIKLWEREGGEREYKIDEAITQALLSFPRNDFIPAMLEGMKSKKEFVAMRCTAVLTQLREKRALDFIVGKVLIPPLTEDQKKQAQELVKDLMEGKGEKTHAAARAKLIDMGPAVIDVLWEYTQEGGFLTDDNVIKESKEIMAELQRTFILDDVRALARFNDDAVLKILRFIVRGETHRFSTDTIDAAIDLLGKRGLPEDAGIIRPYLGKAETNGAIGAVGRLKDKASVPMLVDLLKRNENTDYKIVLIDALANIGDERAVPPLESLMLTESDSSYKACYVNALARLGKREYLRTALQNLSMKEPLGMSELEHQVVGKEEMAILLRQLEGSRDLEFNILTVNLLSYVASHGDTKVIQAIRDARQRMESQGYPHDTGKGEFSISLIRLGDLDEEKAIIDLARSPEPVTRYAALLLLGGTKDEKFIPVLINACDDKGTFMSPHPVGRPDGEKEYRELEVREAAIWGITEISGQPFRLWNFDPDRQVREIKAWYAKYLEQKATEQKQGEN
jgi:HEAT repeat protein